MKKKTLLMVAIAASMGLSACSLPASYLGTSLILATTEPLAATNVVPNKMGKACGVNVFGIVAAGNFSIEAAKRNGGIVQVATVDRGVQSYFGVFSRVCTIVTGQ